MKTITITGTNESGATEVILSEKCNKIAIKRMCDTVKCIHQGKFCKSCQEQFGLAHGIVQVLYDGGGLCGLSDIKVKVGNVTKSACYER